jgi:hypothetical protein
MEILRAGGVTEGWMCEHELVPAKVSVHSWNATGAEAIVAVFRDRGFNATLAPYHHG